MPKAPPLRLGVNVDHVATLRNARAGRNPDPVRAALAAIEAGANTRAALVAFGLDGSHGWERTHIDSLEATYNLLHCWLQTPLTFAKWDAKPSGQLRDFPSSEQPAPSEQWVPLARGEHAEPGDADFIMKSTRTCHGFYGASSMERLPVETALTEQVRRFKSISRQ